MRGGEWEPPLVAREGHTRLEEGLSLVGDTGASKVRRKLWWGKVVGGDMFHMRQEGPWSVHWTHQQVGNGGEHDNHRWTWRTSANPLVRLVSCKNGLGIVDLDRKISTQKTI
jgi:hypothetical protein